MGIIECLMEKLSLSNQSELLPIITALSSDKFRYNGKKPCPCGSGIRMSDCSHKILLLHPPHYKYARMCKKFLEEMERNEQNENTILNRKIRANATIEKKHYNAAERKNKNFLIFKQ